MSRFVALDMGAESGRAIAGILENDKLSLHEVYRFPNKIARVHDSLFWDPLNLFTEMKNGLRKIVRDYGPDFSSLGIDTWGIDYALLDRDGNLVGNPICYRDGRTEGMMDEALKHLTREEIFQQTGGIQFLSINTLFQLLSMVVNHSAQLEAAHTFLMMPDLFNYWFSGRKVVEFTNATTTQMYNSLDGEWSAGVLDTLNIPTAIFPEVVMPGTELGPLSAAIAGDVGFGSLPLIAPATHDTASAVVAVPSAEDDFLWLSSGTWSLLGGISDSPLLSEEALAYNFSSYGGAGGSCLPWKNIMGLWLVQECRRVWAAAGDKLSYDDLTRLAAEAKPFTAVIDPDHASFLAPADMPEAIRQYCRDTGQEVPQTKGEIVRTALESLALRYRWTAEKLGIILDKTYSVMHVVGGGSQNELLCQFTADAAQMTVIAGPVEATAIGNIAVQAVSIGELDSLDEARAVIRGSFDVRAYDPADGEPWDEAYERFNRLLQ